MKEDKGQKGPREGTEEVQKIGSYKVRTEGGRKKKRK